MDEFSLLAGITAVHNHIGTLHEFLNDGKLFFNALVIDELYAEAWRNHRQTAQVPTLPHWGVVVRFLERTEVTESPCHLITVTLNESLAAVLRPKDVGNFLGYTWFLCYTDYHYSLYR